MADSLFDFRTQVRAFLTAAGFFSEEEFDRHLAWIDKVILAVIVDRARAGQYDLLVLSTHGRTGLSHLLMGSVAERVVRTAPCPVLTVRDSHDGYQSFAERRHHRPSVAEQAHDLATEVGDDQPRGK